MPRISRAFVFTSLLYLLLTLSFGVARSYTHRFPKVLAMVLNSFPGYVHLWAIGWLTQLIYGVAYWLLPMIDKQRRRGPIWPMVTSYICLNLGLPMRLFSEPFLNSGNSTAAMVYVFSATLLWLSGGLFCLHIWPRVK